MKKIAIAIAASLTLLSAGSAWAEDKKADPATVAAVSDLMDAMHIKEIIPMMGKQMSQQMPAMMHKMVEDRLSKDPTVTDAKKKEALDKLDKSLPALTKGMSDMLSDPSLANDLIAATSEIYAKHFTTAEIKQMRAFYVSPVGKKMIAEMPKMMPEVMGAAQSVMIPRVNKFAETAVAAATK